MSPKLRLAYLAHSVRSDWNNGNAHFLRGLLRSLGHLGHQVTLHEPDPEWSLDNLRTEPLGAASLQQFDAIYPDLNIHTYSPGEANDLDAWRHRLRGLDIVILHEWHPPALAHLLLQLRDELGYKLLFHDTHHRASSSPQAIESFQTGRFDGILAFGESLRSIYRERFALRRVWTLHEAADTTVFHPLPSVPEQQDVVWIGNWGDGERSGEIQRFLLQPAQALPEARFTIFGVRYPKDGLQALHHAGVRYGGYLPNLQAPSTYAASRLTVHVPRQQYNHALVGIPTIRVFEALACGIPLLSAPWTDSEHLFAPGDFMFVEDTASTVRSMRHLLDHPDAAAEQASRGLHTVLQRHTCMHRAEQLTSICEEVLQ